MAVATFEGTQQILEPQTARFILKVAQDAQEGKASPFKLSSDFDYIQHAADYLGRSCAAETGAELLDPIVQLEAFEARACALLLEASEAIQAEMAGEDGAAGGEAASLQQALSRQGVLLGRLARAHCQLIILRRFHESVARQEARLKGTAGAAAAVAAAGDEVVVGGAEVQVLRKLVHLFALSIMEAEMADFRLQDYCSAAQASMVGRQVLHLCRVVRAEAVCLVDAFQLSDALLSSTLGRADGRVYTAIFEELLKSPINDAEVHESYHRYWRNLLTASGGDMGGARL